MFQRVACRCCGGGVAKRARRLDVLCAQVMAQKLSTRVMLGAAALGGGAALGLAAVPVAHAASGPVVEPKTVSKVVVEQAPFGEPCDDMQASIFLLRSPAGVTLGVTNYGATITHLLLPDRNGHVEDCCLGFDDLAGCRKADNPYFGAIVGRCANRIAGGKFKVDGKAYTVATNNGPNHLHGGICGFDKVIWDATAVNDGSAGAGVKFTYVSADGEEGYPGECTTSVTYMMQQDGSFKLSMESTVTKACPVNLANHTYFNLAGHRSGNILDHKLQIMASRMTPTDAGSIPTGELTDVAGTPFDFRQNVRDADAPTVGSLIAGVRDLPGSGGGYDHNYVLDIGMPDEFGMKLCAAALEPKSGRRMDVHCNTPGVQFYSGNYLGPSQQGGGLDNPPVTGKGGAQYSLHQGFCLETQHYPDSINQPHFPSILLRPGDVYDHRMHFKFSVE